MLIQKYVYNGKEYATERAVRQAIFKQEKKVFGKPETAEQWSALGVAYSEEERVIPLDSLKAQKMNELEERFNEYRQSNEAFIESSLGFRANANITAFNNVSGLVAQLQYRLDGGEANPTIGFMTFDDELVMLTLDGLKALQVEISQNGSLVYGRKWEIRTAIEQAQDEETLNEIDIEF